MINNYYITCRCLWWRKNLPKTEIYRTATAVPNERSIDFIFVSWQGSGLFRLRFEFELKPKLCKTFLIICLLSELNTQHTKKCMPMFWWRNSFAAEPARLIQLHSDAVLYSVQSYPCRNSHFFVFKLHHLIHFVDLVHNMGMKIETHFLTVDILIAWIQATLKNKTRHQNFLKLELRQLWS